MSKPTRNFHQSYEPVSPVDVVDGSQQRSRGVGFAVSEDKKLPSVTARSRTSSSSSTDPSLKTPRTARFAEATSVNSPIVPTESGRSPFADPPVMADSEPKPSDVGFGYVADNDPSRNATYPVEQEANYNPPKSPLKSAMKVPGTPGRMLNPLSPTFREEQILEKHEDSTEKENAKDLASKVKIRVRMAKMVLRGVNFSCSLIVLSMISTTFSIFNATKAIPARNNLPAWASGTNPWPQMVLLVISCVSLAFSLIIFYAYWKGGHNRAQKTAVYYTVFAVFFFTFSIVMWAVGAGILHSAKQNGNGQDLWGWSCKDNKRRTLFQDEIHYALVCRLQNWSLLCAIIEIVVETITIAIYAVVFYRFYSKRKLRKSMDIRDRARSDLYLAQLRSQSAPNTPGFAPKSPGFPSALASPRFQNMEQDEHSAAENGESGYYGTQFATAKPTSLAPVSKQFQLQPPPIRVQHATPKPEHDGFEPAEPAERVNEHVDAAPGEQTYDTVPIPGAYASPLTSPSFQPQHGSMAQQMGHGAPGQAY